MQKVVMQKALVLSLLTLMFTGGLVACGQKGPLYLPQQQTKPQPQVESAPAAKPAPVAPAAAPMQTNPNTDPS